MASELQPLLRRPRTAAQARGLNDRQWAGAAGTPPETLARLKSRTDCDLATLVALAGVVGHAVQIAPLPERIMPKTYRRKMETALCALCTDQTYDLLAWQKAGPRYFLAGLAVMLAGMREMDQGNAAVGRGTVHAVPSRRCARGSLRPLQL